MNRLPLPSHTVERWTAFSSDPAGGNPAGVVLNADELDDARMLAIAAELGYAESAFVGGVGGDGSRRIRYFSPVAEVPFCGHATVASAAALAAREGDGRIVFATPVGPVEIVVVTEDGAPRVSFTSVEPRVDALPAATLAALLRLLGLGEDALDARHPPSSPSPAMCTRFWFSGTGRTSIPSRSIRWRPGG